MASSCSGGHISCRDSTPHILQLDSNYRTKFNHAVSTRSCRDAQRMMATVCSGSGHRHPFITRIFFVKNVTVQTAIYCKRSFVIFGPPESITAALIKRTNERRAATCRPHHFSSADIGEDSAGCCDRRSCYYSIRQPSKTHCARLGRTKIAT